MKLEQSLEGELKITTSKGLSFYLGESSDGTLNIESANEETLIVLPCDKSSIKISMQWEYKNF